MPSKLEVAEAIYGAARATTTVKMPESLDELAPHVQQRYLTLAEGAISVMGDGAGGEANVPQRSPLAIFDELADELAWKYLHPQEFNEGVRTALTAYVEIVGHEHASEDVTKALEL
jgi:hypothetical protein